MNEQNAKDKVLQYPDAATRGPGKPRPAWFKPVWPLVSGVVGTAIVAGGSFFTLVGSRVGTLSGATRSTKLKWEQRQAEIAGIIISTNADDGTNHP
jgi:hypothetical protein